MKIFNTFSSLVFSSRFPVARLAPIPIRLIVGYGFIEHGFAKLSRGVGAFAAILQANGRFSSAFHGATHYTHRTGRWLCSNSGRLRGDC